MRDLNCAVIVAHPDDETLWAGGTILLNPSNQWSVITACRKDDPDRNPKFFSALKLLNADGRMGDLEDGPDQSPVNPEQVEQIILSLLPSREFDLIITHSTQGEYTRHRRHEQVADAVLELIKSQRLITKKLWMFAYTDHNGAQLPMPMKYTDIMIPLPLDIWKKKYEIVTEIYGFRPDSWEGRTTPRKESFWSFNSVGGIKEWIKERSSVV